MNFKQTKFYSHCTIHIGHCPAVTKQVLRFAVQASNASTVPVMWLPLSFYAGFLAEDMRYKGYEQASPSLHLSRTLT